MKKVKIITENETTDLENSVNKFLENNTEIEIFNIAWEFPKSSHYRGYCAISYIIKG